MPLLNCLKHWMRKTHNDTDNSNLHRPHGDRPVLKVCNSCQEEKPESEFPVRADRSGRLRPYCNVCAAEGQRARYRHHRTSNPFGHRCTRARARASILGVPFDLTPEYLESIWTGECPVLKQPIEWGTDRNDELAAELDRFDPNKGYTQGNVCWLSRKANRIKNNTSVEILENLLDWMKNV